MTDAIVVRSAVANDVERLTEIAHSAKAHWEYPVEWLELWRSSLTFDSALLDREWVQVAEDDGVVAAVVAVAGEPPTVELSHLWVDPKSMGRGLGRRLFEAAIDHSRRLGARRLEIVSDPHAEDFYRRFGATRIGDVESEPEGRRLPLLVHAL